MNILLCFYKREVRHIRVMSYCDMIEVSIIPVKKISGSQPFMSVILLK